ncbi:hypothetical protein [Pedobacter ureilyticus]|uniref:Tetratricopeptide repeat protein n=1 Tax=Pedobacter ureilyticus TaxID=1393051 RepID=A0ABW9J9T4_9SPHI|nr:hypothetical protein [Pedobacter helvus]
MARKSTIRSRLRAAQQSEKQGELTAALALYAKVTASDALQANAWHRQMVILRKLKKPEQELQLLKKAISSYRQGSSDARSAWIKTNHDKVESSRALAQTLGLVDKEGLPHTGEDVTSKWAQRLTLLQKRLAKAKKNTLKKKQKSPKKRQKLTADPLTAANNPKPTQKQRKFY